MNNKLQGWQLAVSPRLKANFGSTGTTIFGYDFSKANQAGSDSFTPQSQAIILANQGLSYYNNLTSDTQNASQVNQSLYLIQRLPITSLLEASYPSEKTRHKIKHNSPYCYKEKTLQYLNNPENS